MPGPHHPTPAPICRTLAFCPQRDHLLMAFGRALPRIRKRVAHDLRRGQPQGREQVLAAVVQQIDAALRHQQDLPEQDLLLHPDAEGPPRRVDPADIADYLHEAAGVRFTAGDFRTWHDSVLALTQALAPPARHGDAAAHRPRRGLLADEQQLLRFLRRRGKQARLDPWLPKRAAKQLARSAAACG